MTIKLFAMSLFVLLSGSMFAQKLSPEKANKLLKNQGFVVIKHDLQTNEFVSKLKVAKLKDGKLVASSKGFKVIHGKDQDVLVNAVSTVTVKYPDGKSVTRSCGCDGGGGSCDVKADGGGNYSCEGSDCCSLVTVTVSADGDVSVER